VIRLSSASDTPDASSFGDARPVHDAAGMRDAGTRDDATGDALGSVVPKGKWVNVSGNLAGIPSVCGSLQSMSAKPDEDLLIVGIASVGVYGSRNGGLSWQELSAKSDAGQIVNRMTAIVYDPSDSNRFWECGIYSGSPFVTADDGATWSELGDIGDTDLVSIDFSDPARKTLVAGGHEQSNTLYLSTNGGMVWSPIGAALPANTNCTFPLVFDTQTYLVGCGGYGGGVSGIFRTTDAGKTWTKVTGSGGAAAPLLAADGTIYWASPNNAGMTRSTDKGLTWKDVVGPGVITTDQPIELPDGRLAIMGATYVLISADRGETWTPATAALPTTAEENVNGVVYSAQRKAFYIWHNNCTSFSVPVDVPKDAVMRFDFDYQKE
jgi:photosystem II stability/assembly factor-like uncharacterized protein